MGGVPTPAHTLLELPIEFLVPFLFHNHTFSSVPSSICQQHTSSQLPLLCLAMTSACWAGVDLYVQRRDDFPANPVTAPECSSESNWMRLLSSELHPPSTGETHPDLDLPLPFYTKAAHTFSQAWKDQLVPLWILLFLPTGFSDPWLVH